MRLPNLLLLTTFLLISSCQVATLAPTTTLTFPASREQDGLHISLTSDHSDYALGDIVRITYRLTNTTSESQLFGQVPNCDYCINQVHILHNGEEIWRSCRVIPPCGQKELILAPAETWEFTIEWPLVDDHGTLEPEDDTPIPPGLFNAIAELQVDKVAYHLPVSIQIVIQ